VRSTLGRSPDLAEALYMFLDQHWESATAYFGALDESLVGRLGSSFGTVVRRRIRWTTALVVAGM
jgi:hypothetical protein